MIFVLIALLCSVESLFTQQVRSDDDHYYLSSAQYYQPFASPPTLAMNPAVITPLRGLLIGLFHENRFSVKGLGYSMLAVIIRQPLTSFSFYFQTFGNINYAQHDFGISYGRSLGSVTIATTFHLNRLQITGFPAEMLVGFHLHTLWKISENVFVSVRYMNPPVQGKSHARLASQSSFGMGYRISEKVYAGCEIIKTELRKALAVALIQYQLNDDFRGKLGFLTGQAQPFFGVGWQYKNIKLEIAVSYHLQLGSTPGLLIEYQKTAPL